MEIVEYIGSDGFVHYIFSNSMGVPFFLYVLLICASISFISIILKKIVG